MKKYFVPSLLLGVCISVSSVFAQTSTYSDVAPSQSTCSITNTLRIGSRDRFTGGDVSLLQKDLKMMPTGYFGDLTKTAVQKFQTSNLAKSDYYYSSNGRIVNEYGVVNTATRLKLNEMYCRSTTPTEPYVCTADAKMCEDGSYVSRTGPGCAFAACPAPTEAPIIIKKDPSSSLDSSMTMMREASFTEAGSDILGAPTNPVISISPYKLLFTSTETFKLTWSALNAISYKLKIDGAIKGPFTETELSTTFAALGYTSNGAHWFAVQGCNVAGCGPWSSILSASIGGVGTGTITPSPYFYVDNNVVYNGSSVTVKDGNALFRWGSSNASSCTLNGVSVPVIDTIRSFSGLVSGTQTFSCVSSTGVVSVLKFNITVSTASPVVVTNPTLSLSANGVSVSNGSTVTATGGSASFSWGSTNASSCMLNGTSVQTSGSQTFTGLTTGARTYSCTSASGGSATISFNVVVPAPVVVTNPTLSLSANGVSVSNGSTVTATGGSASFSWGSTNASSCMLNGTSVQTSGSQTFTGLTTGARTYSCTSASGGSATISFNVVVPAPVVVTNPTLSLSANGVSVSNGSTVTATGGSASFSWGSTNASSCMLNGTSVQTSGSQTFTGLTTGARTYSCTSASGGSATISFNVVVPAPVVVTNPTLSLSANGVSVSNGSTVTATGGSASFSWGSTNASSCMLNGTSVQTSGSQTFTGLTTGARTYSCTSASGGSATISFNVVVPETGGSPAIVPSTATLSITPYKMLYGFTETFRLDWSATNATSYKLKVDNVERMTFTDSGYSTTFTALGFTVRGAHSFQVQGCNAAGCGAWSNQIFVSIGGANTVNSLKNKLTVINGVIVSQSEALAGSIMGATTASASSDTCTNITTNLHRGYETASVSKLQNFLISKGLLSEKASGFFGDLTIEAVKAYQRSLGLPQTGMVYDITRQAIREETCQ